MKVKLNKIQVKSFITTLQSPHLLKGGAFIQHNDTRSDVDPTKTSSVDLPSLAACRRTDLY